LKVISRFGSDRDPDAGDPDDQTPGWAGKTATPVRGRSSSTRSTGSVAGLLWWVIVTLLQAGWGTGGALPVGSWRSRNRRRSWVFAATMTVDALIAMVGDGVNGIESTPAIEFEPLAGRGARAMVDGLQVSGPGPTAGGCIAGLT
jgi:hypothetical protein